MTRVSLTTEDVAGPEVLGEVGERPVLDPTGRAIQDQEA